MLSVDPVGSWDVVVDGLVFPESPRWHDGRLWVSDLHDDRVLGVGPGGTLLEEHTVSGGPSGTGWIGSELVVAVMGESRLTIGTGSGRRELSDLSDIGSPNDLLVTDGAVLVGIQGYDFIAGEPFASGSIVVLDHVGAVRETVPGLSYPNGMALLDPQTVLVAETVASRLTAFAFDGGALGARRVWAELPGATPDGIAVDAAGGVWVADPGGRRVLRIREGGVVTHELPTPGARPFACALGGPELRALYVCAASSFRPEVARAARSGRVLAAEVEAPALSAVPS
jgi:sugar lactone lactonase YvrE